MAVELVTFGCRLNLVESEAMKREAEAAGHDDLVIVNTCAVTGEAVRQARQSIRRLKRERPDARIVVTGCAAQIEPATFAAMAEVESVIGNSEKAKSGTWAALRDPATLTERVQVADIMTVRETAPQFLDAFEGQTRAFLQVQNGCDHRCTFCIIPYGRGNSRSVPMGAVVEQGRRLVDNGYQEIVLTGVDLTSWGSDLPGSPRLGQLVQALLRHLPDLRRLRLSSIDSVEADDALLDALASEPRLMPHLHLSLQSGDDLILKRMKRRHNRDDAIRFCERVHALRPDLAFGADFIAGFPTENEGMFDQSVDLIRQCRIIYLHIFPFSPRPGTPAARMPQVPRDVIKARAARLREVGEAALARHLASRVGLTLDVLTERGGMGRAEDFTAVRFAAPPEPGRIIKARITGQNGRELLA